MPPAQASGRASFSFFSWPLRSPASLAPIDGAFLIGHVSRRDDSTCTATGVGHDNGQIAACLGAPEHKMSARARTANLRRDSTRLLRFLGRDAVSRDVL